MSCSCQSSKFRGEPGPVQPEASDEASTATAPQRRQSFELPQLPYSPHTVHPDESCVFCALKHASAAYTLAATQGIQSAVIGELELARRHTLLEFPEAASLVSRAELLFCLRRDDAVKALEGAITALQNAALAADPGSKDNPRLPADASAPVSCPLVGEVRVGAAWRLAFEVGYMELNRSMIVGDLSLAQEDLVRHDPRIAPYLRDLRHRVESTDASDLHVEWPLIGGAVSELVRRNLDGWAEEYGPDLRAYLGAPAD